MIVDHLASNVSNLSNGTSKSGSPQSQYNGLRGLGSKCLVYIHIVIKRTVSG